MLHSITSINYVIMRKRFVTAAALGGHASIAMIDKTYAHAIKSAKARTADKVGIKIRSIVEGSSDEGTPE